MAFFQRARDFGSRAIRGLTGLFRQELPPPTRQPEPPPREPFGFPTEPVYQPETIPTQERPYDFGDDDYQGQIEIENDFGRSFYYTYDQWYELTLMDKDTLLDLYGMDNLDIIYDLEEQNIPWDWDSWREDYDAARAGV